MKFFKNFVIAISTFALLFASTTQAQEPTNSVSTATAFHKASIADVGRPGSGLAPYTDKAMVAKIVSGGIHGGHLHENAPITIPVVAPVATSFAIVKDATNRSATFIGNLSMRSVVVCILNFPDGRTSVLPALTVMNPGDWWIGLWQGDLGFFFGFQGPPDIEIRVFDPNRGSLTSVSTVLDFWGPPRAPGGIKDVSLEGNSLRVAGGFEWNTKVFLNHTQVSEFALSRSPHGIVVNLGGIPENLVNFGQNLLTVVSESGRCDSYGYRYNPW